jgi:hypothetical protein
VTVLFGTDDYPAACHTGLALTGPEMPPAVCRRMTWTAQPRHEERPAVVGVMRFRHPRLSTPLAPLRPAHQRTVDSVFVYLAAQLFMGVCLAVAGLQRTAMLQLSDLRAVWRTVGPPSI